MCARRNGSRNAAQNEPLKAIAEPRGTYEDAVSAPLFRCFAEFSFRITFFDHTSNLDRSGPQKLHRAFRDLCNPLLLFSSILFDRFSEGRNHLSKKLGG